MLSNIQLQRMFIFQDFKFIQVLRVVFNKSSSKFNNININNISPIIFLKCFLNFRFLVLKDLIAGSSVGNLTIWAQA